MSFMEIEGKTLEEAVENACKAFGVTKDMLNIEVVSAGSTGIFGLIRKAKIKASLREPEQSSQDEDLERAKETLENIVSKLDPGAKVSGVRKDQEIMLSIDGGSSALLIGKRGQTLDAIQYLVNRIVNRSSKENLKVIVDTETYRRRREQSLVNLAHRLGEKAKRLGKPVSVDPMNAHDRRIIHLALQGDEMLKTKSSGDGLLKRVVIFPKKRGD